MLKNKVIQEEERNERAEVAISDARVRSKTRSEQAVTQARTGCLPPLVLDCAPMGK